MPATNPADRAADRKLQQPVLALWSTHDDLQQLYGDPVGIWRSWALNVTGYGIESGHHMAEQAPAELAESLQLFLCP